MERLEEFVAAAIHWQADRQKVQDEADRRGHGTVCQIHVPLEKHVLPKLRLNDPEFGQDLVEGFPYVGDMVELDYCAKSKRSNFRSQAKSKRRDLPFKVPKLFIVQSSCSMPVDF